MVCWVAITIMLVLTFLYARFQPPTHDCVATLVWFTGRYAVFGTSAGSFAILMYLILAGVIAYQLQRTMGIERDERIAATRMVYYLLASVALLVGSVPSP